MKYQNCLNECIECTDNQDYQEIYGTYPSPDTKVWKRCVAEAEMLWGNEMDAFNCIARYEVLLATQGHKTVSAVKAETLISELIYAEWIPGEILVAAVIRETDTCAYNQLALVPELEWSSVESSDPD